MGDARKAWQDAKGTIKEKDWESELKFRDDLGPDLDSFQKLFVDIHSELQSVSAKLHKGWNAAKLISTTKKSYEAKINSAKSQFDAWHSDHGVLIKGLEKAMDLASHDVANVRGFLTAMLKITENSAEELEK